MTRMREITRVGGAQPLGGVGEPAEEDATLLDEDRRAEEG
jgi:hypothetical protein